MRVFYVILVVVVLMLASWSPFANGNSCDFGNGTSCDFDEPNKAMPTNETAPAMDSANTPTLSTILEVMDSNFNRFREEMTEMNARFSTFQEETTALKNDLGALENKLDAKFSTFREEMNATSRALENKLNALENKLEELRRDVADGFRFPHNRISTLKEATLFREICRHDDGGIEQATAHAIVYNDIVATITVAHSNCSAPPSNFIPCDDIDVALIIGCPELTTVLNISAPARLRMGDKTVSFGFINKDTIRAWNAHSMGEIGINRQGQSFSGSAHIHLRSDEFLLSAYQVAGISGAPSANACGYLGMAHAKGSDEIAHAAVVIPAYKIHQCLTKHKDKLSRLSDCSVVNNVANLPTSIYEDCSI